MLILIDSESSQAIKKRAHLLQTSNLTDVQVDLGIEEFLNQS